MIFQEQLGNVVPTLAISQAASSATKMLIPLLAQDVKADTNLLMEPAFNSVTFQAVELVALHTCIAQNATLDCLHLPLEILALPAVLIIV